MKYLCGCSATLGQGKTVKCELPYEHDGEHCAPFGNGTFWVWSEGRFVDSLVSGRRAADAALEALEAVISDTAIYGNVRRETVEDIKRLLAQTGRNSKSVFDTLSSRQPQADLDTPQEGGLPAGG